MQTQSNAGTHEAAYNCTKRVIVYNDLVSLEKKENGDLSQSIGDNGKPIIN